MTSSARGSRRSRGSSKTRDTAFTRLGDATINGLKDIENRPRRTRHRGPLPIHASKSLDDYSEHIEFVKTQYGISVPSEVNRGGIVDVIDCVEIHKSDWFSGPFGWVLANPRRLKFRPCNGALGLFRPKY
jgi:hypothetical protein